MPEDFYDLLDVPPDADEDEIKRAFRERAREYHPDVNEDERASGQFKTLRRARDVLTDPTERAAYERLGHEAYVAKRMGGLPSDGLGGGESSTGASRDGRQRRRRRRQTSERRDRSDDGRSDDRYGDGAAFARRRRRRRASLRRRRIAAEGAAAVAACTYLLGLSLFVAANAAALGDAVAAPAASAGALGLDPMAYSRAALSAGSLGLALPVGAALFPLGVGAASLRASRRFGSGVTVAALAPAAGIALAAAAAPVAVVVACLVVGPVVAVPGLVRLATRRRR